MKKNILIMTTVLALAGGGFALAAPAFNGPLARHAPLELLPPEMRDSVRECVTTAVRGLLNLRKEAPLSAEQRTKIQSVIQSHRAEITAQMKTGQAARKAMRDAVVQNGAGSAQAQTAAVAIGEMARQRALLVGRIGAEIHPVLTEQQQQGLDALRGEMEQAVDTLISSTAL